MRKSLVFLTAVSALTVGVGCSSDEPLQLSSPQPADFSAAIGRLQSRVSGSRWTTGDAIGISGTSGTKVYSNIRHNVADTSTGSFAVASEANRIYFQTTADVTFTAYYPYGGNDGTERGKIAVDCASVPQTAARQQEIDFLWSSATTNFRTPSVNFTFSHCMSKFTFEFLADDGSTQTGITSYRIDGLTTQGSFDTSTGLAAIDASKGITPIEVTDLTQKSLIVLPQTPTGDVTLSMDVDGQTYACSLDLTEVEAGVNYSYKVKLSNSALTLQSSTISNWSDTDKGTLQPTLVPDEEIKVGSIYYSDGTFSNTPRLSGTPIGVVFYVGHNPYDKSNYSSTPIGKENCNGYVVALDDVIDRDDDPFGVTDFSWGPKDNAIYNYPNGVSNLTEPDKDWSGQKYTQDIITWGADGRVNLHGNNPDGYPATYYSVVYFPTITHAPANSSGWFLPSIGQMKTIHDNEAEVFANIDAKPIETYWTSSENSANPGSYALAINMQDGRISSVYKDQKKCVRPVLAF